MFSVYYLIYFYPWCMQQLWHTCTWMPASTCGTSDFFATNVAYIRRCFASIVVAKGAHPTQEPGCLGWAWKDKTS